MILDLVVILASVTCLILPIVFYHEYTRENHLARLWVKYMPIPTDSYFSFTVPATLSMILGFRLPLISRKLKINENPGAYIENAKNYLSKKPRLGLTLIAIGVASGLLDFLSPSSLKQVFYLSAHLTYVGVFYVIYSPNKHKRIVVPSVIAIMIGQALFTGMFGDFIFMLACSMVLILLGKKITFRRKLYFVLAGILLILLIQSVKIEYRKRSWSEGAGADPAYFIELMTDRVTDPSSMLDDTKMFYSLMRLNQGWLVAMTMKRVPSKYPFADGETIWQSVAAAIVPRFLWPDKPESGGRDNLKRFWGFNLVGYSMNIGPYGEAYANFDRTGGIIYMFFYGLFFGMVLSTILKIADKRPTIILWLPFLFFYAIGVETDLLTTMGFLVKGVFFTWVVFRFFRIGFRIDL